MTPAFGLLCGVLAATGVLRLAELVVSRRRTSRRLDQLVAEPWLFGLMALLHLALVTLPAVEVIVADRPFVPWVTAAAGIGLVAATALRVWTLHTLGASWNVRVVLPETVVTTGPYRWIRHPNYLAVITEMAAIPLLHTAWMSALGLSLLNALVLTHRIRVEEAELARLTAWRHAMADKARLIPGLL